MPSTSWCSGDAAFNRDDLQEIDVMIANSTVGFSGGAYTELPERHGGEGGLHITTQVICSIRRPDPGRIGVSVGIGAICCWSA
jgi:hypothetical protein